MTHLIIASFIPNVITTVIVVITGVKIITNTQIGIQTNRMIKGDWKIMLLYIQNFGKNQISLGTTFRVPIPCISFVSLRQINDTELAFSDHDLLYHVGKIF